VILIGLLLALAGLSLTVFSVVRSLRHPRGKLLTAAAEGRRLIMLAALAALLPAVALAVIPFYASSTGERSTLVDVNGAGVLLVLLLPVLLAASPLLVRGPGQVLLAASCGTLLAVFCVLGGFSVGSYYLPAATLLLAAAAVGLRARTA